MARAAALRGRAVALVSTLARRAADTEQRRQLPTETVADLRAAGLFRLVQPRRFGGAELPLDQAIDIVSVLARGCASTAWVCAIYCDHSILLGKFDDAALDDVWARTPEALVSAGLLPGGMAERAPGGWRISGRWGFASGCDHADWLLLGSPLPLADGTIQPSLCLVPRSEVQLEDNWHVMGLAGTGSKELVVEGTVVPEHRTLPLWKVAEGAAGGGRADVGPLYRLPHFPSVPFLFHATALGIAESLLEITIESIKGRSSMRNPGGQKLAELQSMQLHVAEASAEIDCARTLIMRDTAAAMVAMREGRALTLPERARNRRDQGYTARLCRQAVDRLFGTFGSHGLFADHAEQRKFRDLHAVSAHLMCSWDLGATAYGRVALGLEPATIFI
jgi:3-hydroxy-9,10-secoandrosta-1,3,5(10)-triene-9,17-dione monooxygenase